MAGGGWEARILLWMCVCWGGRVVNISRRNCMETGKDAFPESDRLLTSRPAQLKNLSYICAFYKLKLMDSEVRVGA